jgi:uncharacterized protein
MRVVRINRTRAARRTPLAFLAQLLSLVAIMALVACGASATATTAPSAAPASAAGGGASAAASASRPASAAPAGSAAASASASGAAPASAAAGGAATPSTAATPARPGSPTAGGGGTRPPAGACTPDKASGAKPTGRQRYVIGTGGTGGVFYPYGGGLAKILTAKMTNTEVTAETTGGSVDNNKLVAKDPTYIAMSTADSADEAQKGIGVYTDTKAIPICTIAVLYDSFIHVVVAADSGINTIADMKGKRISVGSAGSSTEVAADRLLEAAGLNPKSDITRDNLSVQESANAIKDKKIAGFFWIGGLPTAAVTELIATGPKVKFIDLAQYVQPLSAKFGPVYYLKELPANTYKDIAATPGMGVDNLLLVRNDMPTDVVYEMLKALFDNQAEVQAVHPEAKKFNLQSAVAISPVPFHPGAIKYYTEKGVYRP